jgi:hypothetical protein
VITHGHTVGGQSKLYRVWANMWKRCSYPGATDFAYYGGRGIGVCKRWRSFETFLADMGVPAPGMTLDRKNSDRDYSPRNCRWATRREQQATTRRSTAIRRLLPQVEKLLARGVAARAIAERLRLSRTTVYRIKNGTWGQT